jgi:outer membrane protein OmpA-like peptidoglycan-associated protein
MRTRRQSATLLSDYLQVAVVPITRVIPDPAKRRICLIVPGFQHVRRIPGMKSNSVPALLAAGTCALLCLIAPPVPAQPRTQVPIRVAAISARALRHELDSAEALLRTQFAGLPEGSGVVLLRDPQSLTVRIPSRELFDADSAQLSHEHAKALPWSAVIALLHKRRRLEAQIYVYTDSIGGSSLNQSFSQQRALALMAAMHAAAIRPERVSAAGLGASAELAINDTPEGREQNRRVEVVFGPPPMRLP